MGNSDQKEQSILKGRFKLITEFNEMRASQWVRGFGINDANGNVVLPLMSSFDLDGFEETGDTLKVKFKIFPNGLKQYAVEIDPANRRFAYEGNTISLDNLAKTFE